MPDSDGFENLECSKPFKVPSSEFKFTHKICCNDEAFFCQQESFGKNQEKQQAREVGWGIGTFCIQGIEAIR